MFREARNLLCVGPTIMETATVPVQCIVITTKTTTIKFVVLHICFHWATLYCTVLHSALPTCVVRHTVVTDWQSFVTTLKMGYSTVHVCLYLLERITTSKQF